MAGFTRSGATRLATEIQIYWVTRGVSEVKTWIEPIGGIIEDMWSVRSNVGELLGRRNPYSNAVLQRSNSLPV